MFFSVVIPLYNKERYIDATLQSVVAQTWEDYEVLLVDDGSTDGSLSLVEPFLRDSRFRLIRQTNAGVSVARNTGINQARGEYICFLDADDLWLPEYLQTAHDNIMHYPEIRMVVTAYNAFETNPSQPLFRCTLERYFMDRVRLVDFYKYCVLRGGTFAQTSGVIIHREVFSREHLEFRPGCSMGEDLDMWVRVAAKGEVLYINQPLESYRYDWNEGLVAEGKSIRASYPYWEWYNVDAVSPYKDTFTSLMMYSMAHKGMRQKEYELTRQCLHRVQGGDYLLKRIILYLRSILHI